MGASGPDKSIRNGSIDCGSGWRVDRFLKRVFPLDYCHFPGFETLLFLASLSSLSSTALKWRNNSKEGGREGGRERQTDTHTQTQKMLKILKRNRYDAQLDGNIARKQQEQVDPDENQSGIEDSKRHIPRKTSSAIRPIKSHKTKNERIQLKRNTNPLPRILEHVRDDDDGDIGIQSEWRIDGFHGRSCH